VVVRQLAQGVAPFTISIFTVLPQRDIL